MMLLYLLSKVLERKMFLIQRNSRIGFIFYNFFCRILLLGFELINKFSKFLALIYYILYFVEDMEDVKLRFIFCFEEINVVG